jgi:POT family proton-dependent oligopeptide transporter
MAIALAIFWAGTRHYVRAPPSGPNPHSFLHVVGRALKRAGTGRAGEHWLDGARDAHPQEAVDGAKAVFRIVGVFAAVSLFWALFDQKGSSWVIQARQLDRVVLGAERSPALFQVFNPFFVMTLIPLFTWAVFPALERRGVSLTPLRKMTVGMFLTAASFGAAAILQTIVDRGGAPPSVMWQLLQYVLLTSGEVLVSVTGLEFSYSQAPRSMRSTIMSLWLLAVAVGNLITAVISKAVKLEGAAYFWLFAGLMLAAAFAFRAVARRYRPVPAAVAAAAP